jgi:hypothetical protein
LLKVLLDYKDSHRDLLTVRKINELHYIFEKNEKQQGYLMYLYKVTNDKGGFKKFYQEMIDSAIQKETSTQKQIAANIMKRGIKDTY